MSPIQRLLSKLYWRSDDELQRLSQRGVKPFLELVVHEEATAWSRFEMPLGRRVWLWRHGFISQADVLYDVDERTRHRYLSSYQRELTRPINGQWRTALQNKLLFHRLLQPFDAHRSTVHGHLHRGQFTAVDAPESDSNGEAKNANDRTTDSVARVKEYLTSANRLVLKPIYGVSGNRVLICSVTDGSYSVNGEERSEREFEELVASLDGYLVCEYVEQADYADDLFRDSSNTIRVLTMWDPDTDEPFIADAVHRIGTERSAPRDNWSRGGLSAAIDRSTGRLGEGVQYPYDGSLEWHSTHPETGNAIAGSEVPGWEAVKEKLTALAGRFPQIPYVGWDIVVTDPGEFTVIEGNTCSGVRVFQVHRPLLADPRVRRFYEHHDVI
ncbi:sugar-transfer associated ATP-grasp domain-containing protein [Halococcus hamelinensis]|uniref:Alpha-L-glutamate ligase-related protein ATP-grasp domain-containing protein n=1 Tax=Halococcus hamelinensis 100A6 TaxID=1132509 RepID=M0LZR3_9EURY|nr:sugar-transfer associated ATP-grasp domain-containing protein [Halococcus hamelinensis]EMA39032.1 hypothetical protein C447_07743 [Halococcus hamelinensis 100A6]